MMRCVVLTIVLFLVFDLCCAQVDTSYVYSFTPYGTLDIRLSRGSNRYYYLQEGSTFSFRESAPGTKTNTFRDMTSWDSSPYTEGQLREKTNTSDDFIMNYRLLKPEGYKADYAEGYPLIVVLHGAAERGNCWDNSCYHAARDYNPIANNPAAPTNADNKLLNNDHQLIHGGRVHLDAVKLAGIKLPNDASLNARAFPGFVLFPQNLNGWDGDAVHNAIRMIRLLVKKYRIDEDRIYIEGISNGGSGLYQALKRAPWMFAAAIAMSPIDDGFITNVNYESKIAPIPIWVFQGGQDDNPYPAKTKNFIKKFQDAGVVVRYTEYPELGHSTWNSAFKEPDFFSWLLKRKRSEIHPFAGNPALCAANGSGLNLQLPEGFKAYQWQKDGQTIAAATGATYIATSSGAYRARFSRLSATPTEAQWNEWSPAVNVTIQNQPSAEVVQRGTVVLKDLNGGSDARLEAAGTFAHYYWYKNGTRIDFAGDQDDTVKLFVVKPSFGNGAYTLSVSNYDNCESAQTPAKNIFFNDSAPVNITAPTDFKGESPTPSSINLSWKDNANNEVGYEVWRRSKTAEGQTSSWELASLTNANVTSFQDQNLTPSLTYQYKLRAVGAGGRSNYTPQAANEFLSVNTTPDTEPPVAPNGLLVSAKTLTSAMLSWKKSSDTGGLREYLITYNQDSILTGKTDTTFVLENLTINTVYNISVKAIDKAGNKSKASNVVSYNLAPRGLYYEYITGGWTSLDSVKYMKPEVTGFVESFTLAPKTQEDYFYFRFDGYIYIRNAGGYQFRTTSNDGSRLSINGNVVVDNNGVHDLKTVESPSNQLAEGAQRITVDFFDYTVEDSLRVEYKGADTNNEWVLVSAEVLRSNLVTAVEPGASSGDFTFVVFPNPTSGRTLNIQVESTVSYPVSIRIYDPVGKLVLITEAAFAELSTGMAIQLPAGLKRGIYIVLLQQGNTAAHQKFIVQD